MPRFGCLTVLAAAVLGFVAGIVLVIVLALGSPGTRGSGTVVVGPGASQSLGAVVAPGG